MADSEDTPGLPQRGRQSGPAGVPEGFRPFTPIESVSKAAPAEPKPEPESKAPPITKAPRQLPRGAASRSRLATPPKPRPESELAPVNAERPPRGSSRSKVLSALIGGALVVLIVAAVALWGPGSGDVGTEPTTDTSSQTAESVSPYLLSPMALVADTEYVQTEVIEGGDLLVTHWIRTSLPASRVDLSARTRAGVENSMVRVSELVVAADGARLDLADPVVTDAQWTGDVPAARNLYVQYQLSGVLQRSDSAQGRALATMTSLDVGVGPDLLRKTQAFPGAQVLTIACLPPGARATPQPCGTLDEGLWTVVSEAETLTDTVIGQFDLGAS